MAAEANTKMEAIARYVRLSGYLVDVFRMPAPGGWLVTTVVGANGGNDSYVMGQSTVFVADPNGEWRIDADGEESHG